MLEIVGFGCFETLLGAIYQIVIEVGVVYHILAGVFEVPIKQVLDYSIATLILATEDKRERADSLALSLTTGDKPLLLPYDRIFFYSSTFWLIALLGSSFTLPDNAPNKT